MAATRSSTKVGLGVSLTALEKGLQRMTGICWWQCGSAAVRQFGSSAVRQAHGAGNARGGELDADSAVAGPNLYEEVETPSWLFRAGEDEPGVQTILWIDT